MSRSSRSMSWIPVALALIPVGLAACSDDTTKPESPKYTQDQIDRGMYLVTAVAACIDCHTPRKADGSLYADSLLAGAEFIPGLLSAPNLTPDPETGLGNWTDEQIQRAIREGVGHFEEDPDGEPLSPIMPYYVFGNLTDEDAVAIVAYLRSLPPIRNETPERSPLMVPPAPAPVLDYDSIPGPASHGKYLAAAAGLCVECHTPRLETTPPDPSALDPSRYFAGGEEFPIPGLEVHSANLTPDDSTGIGAWSDEDIQRALQEGKDREGRTLCPPMPWPSYAGLTAADVDSLIAYLRALPAIENTVPECRPTGTR